MTPRQRRPMAPAESAQTPARARLGLAAGRAQYAGMRVSAVIVLLALAAGAGPVLQAQEVTIYRCTDGRGRLSLRDTPCTSGQKQETRSMLRPKDTLAPAAAPASAPPPRDTAPSPRVVVISAPRPLYECITPDGARYTSDTSAGNPRWVPLWTLGYPLHAGGVASTDLSITGGSVRIDGNRTVLTPPYPAFAYGAGTWVRDQCNALPPQEVCARLRDRRDAIRRRFFNAMPSERDVLRLEERSVNARLDNDCGGQ